MSDALLPKGWAAPTIGELFMVVGGGTPSTKEPQYWGDGYPWITSADIDSSGQIQMLRDVTKFGVENSTTNVVPPRTVLVVTRVGLGKVAIATQEICFSQDVQGLLPLNEVDPEYCLHFLSHEMQRLKFDGRGTTISGITKKQLKDAVFPLPPLAEQKRIVAKIEELFAKLDKGIESLRDAQTRLKLYRQSLLKHAFEGKLTADWRTANAEKLETPNQILARIKSERAARHAEQMAAWEEAVTAWKRGGQEGKKPTKPAKIAVVAEIEDDELESLPLVPSSWRYCRLQEIAEIGSGMSVSKSRKLSDPIEVAYLRVANVQRGALDLDEVKSMKIERSQLAGLKLQPNDVLFNEGGDRDKLGRGWVWEGQLDPCITQNHVFRATPYHRSLQWSQLISHFGNSFGQKYFDKGGKQTTNLASINKTVLKAFPVPVMSPEEMDVLETRLVESMSRLDLVEAEVETQLAKSEALRQSILKQAFSGKLVPQDPDDEPASVLLERIRAERAAAKPPKRQPRKRNAKAKA